MFIRYGRITEIRVNRDRFTGRCKGFGFVAMAREEEVDEVGEGGGVTWEVEMCVFWCVWGWGWGVSCGYEAWEGVQ
jgi:hypothetical protein